MKILLDGYFDHNLGDDLMLTLAAEGLKEHELYVPSDKIKLENTEYTTAKSGFDAYLKVTGSGFRIYNTLGIAYRLKDMRRENKYAPVKAVLNCNISGFINKAAPRVINKQLSRYDFITVRDSYSYDYIKNTLPQLNVQIYPDLVFSLPDSIIPDTHPEGLLGISVHNNADCQGLAEIADGYIRATGNGVLLLCFDTGVENDALAAERVREGSKYKDKIQTVLYENIPQMLTEIKRCSALLAIRFHSIVLAARMGIPFVPMQYSAKTQHALSGIGYRNALWRADRFAAGDVLDSLLRGEVFKLPEDTERLAAGHVKVFNEFLKQTEK